MLQHSSAWLRSAFLIAIACAALGVRAEDKVTVTNAQGVTEVLTGTVKKDDLDNVVVDKQGAERTVPAASVTDIEWGIADSNWRDGLASYKRGAYGEATKDLQTVAENLPKAPEKARPYIQFIYAESLLRSGKAADAVPMLEKFATELKTSRYIPQVVGLLAEASIQTKNFKNVTDIFNALRGAGGEQKQVADLYEGQVLLAQGKAAEAESKFAAAAGGSVPVTKAQALVGQGRCQIEKKTSSRARELALQALAISTDAKVAGPAHLVIGDATLLEIEERGLKDAALETALLDAANEYMRVQVQYASDSRSEGHALLRAGDCFLRLSKLPNRATDKDRALTMYGRLQSDRFRGSSYSVDAQKAMQTMK